MATGVRTGFTCCTAAQTSSVPHQVADYTLASVLWTLRSARTHHPPTVPVSLQPLPCRSCPCQARSSTCSLAREDVLYPTLGAQSRLWWRKGVSTFQQKLRLPDTSTVHCRTVCGACLFSTAPCVHKPPPLSCPLVFNALSWAAIYRGGGGIGLEWPCFHTRNMAVFGQIVFVP